MNRFSVVTTTPATYKPVTLNECKDALEIVGTAHDSKIAIMLAAATSEAEHYTGQMFAQRTVEVYFERVATFYQLPVGPVRSLSSVEVLNTSYTAFTDYQANLNRKPPLVKFNSLPSVDDSIVPVKLTLEVGYNSSNSPADADLIPDDIKQAIIFHVYQSFMTRGELSPEARTTFRNMLHPYRILHI